MNNNNSFFLILSVVTLLYGCSSSKEEVKVYRQGHLKTIIVDGPITKLTTELGHRGETQDSVVRISFYQILDMDSLYIRKADLLNKDSFHKLLKIPIVAIRSGVEGQIMIRFNVDSSGTAYNIKALAGIGAGVEDAFIDAIKKFNFNIYENNQLISTQNIIMLLVAYTKFSSYLKQFSPTQVIK